MIVNYHIYESYNMMIEILKLNSMNLQYQFNIV